MKRAPVAAVDHSLGAGGSGSGKKRPARQKEGARSDAIREALAYEPGLLLLRNSRCAVVKGNRMVRGGLGGNGAADLVGVLAIDVYLVGSVAKGDGASRSFGRAIALEVKDIGKIPGPAEIDRVLGKVAVYQARDKWAAMGPARFMDAWSGEVKRLDPADRRILEQEAFLVSWREAGGFAAFVDSVESARAAIARARAGASS